MRKLLRRLALALSVVLLLTALAGFIYRDRLLRLHAVNTLFAAEKIVGNFSSMKDLFFWKPIPSAGNVVAWPQRPAKIAERYRFDGSERSVSEWLDRTTTTSFLVAHDGFIVHEEYRLGTKREDLRISWSIAKSMLSAGFGIAVAEGAVKSLDDQVTIYAPTLKGTAYDGASIRNVLNMASGVKFNEDYLDFNSDINRMGRVLALGGTMDDFTASIKERVRPPGTQRQYVSTDTHVLAMVLRAATGKELATWLGERLFGPLGVESEPYYLTDGIGVEFALGGINLTTRDYARFGQLFVDGGRWQGRQIVPEYWVRESVMPNSPPAASPRDPFGYGYQWWVPIDSDGEFYAIGVYGQYIYVNPRARVVVVKTSADRKFRDDGNRGRVVQAEAVAAFRAIAQGLSGWQSPER